ncbi:Gfo/Idh/MocA family protein [Paenibacillus oleatilyticus]|uniref:Gfo/Idh/MocA family protein n=1 Tax=Paenibacillus oleatilyticus TaxID=2594886 RepID=A0ABV4V1W1_9BACL
MPEEFAQKFEVKHIYSDYDEMLKDENLDAVSVCVWNYDHASVAIKALKAGKHVLCEKPLAINLKEAEEIYRVAKECGKILMVGFVKRFFKNTMVLKEFIDKGDFGDIYFAKGTYVRRFGNPGG